MKILPNSLGNNNSRRIPIRQRTLHPSMCGYLDIAESSASDPGQSPSLSPYCDLHSMYFDDSKYENEMHFKINQYRDECPLDDESEEAKFHCDNEADYNEILNKLYKAAENKFQMSGTPNNPMEIVIEKDPRDNYRVFDESNLMADDKE